MCYSVELVPRDVFAAVLRRVKKAATDDDRDDHCVREKSSCVPSKVDEARHGWPPIRPYSLYMVVTHNGIVRKRHHFTDILEMVIHFLQLN